MSRFVKLQSIIGASLVAQMVKNLPAVWETWIQSLVGKIPWRREGLSTPGFLPGEPHGWRSLAGKSPWGHSESSSTEWPTLSVSLFQLHTQGKPKAVLTEALPWPAPTSPSPNIWQEDHQDSPALTGSNARHPKDADSLYASTNWATGRRGSH